MTNIQPFFFIYLLTRLFKAVFKSPLFSRKTRSAFSRGKSNSFIKTFTSGTDTDTPRRDFSLQTKSAANSHKRNRTNFKRAASASACPDASKLFIADARLDEFIETSASPSSLTSLTLFRPVSNLFSASGRISTSCSSSDISKPKSLQTKNRPAETTYWQKQGVL